MSRRFELPYQPSFDGIRAVAVLGVMAFHSGAGLSGGFLGVDVFFALSGFLITTLLVAEYERSGKIDLLAFWGRRARRLLPALLLVVAAVAVYIWAIEPAQTRDAVRADALSALFYSSNWRFVLSGQSYFAQFEAPTPLLHTWSLAIEEQFYIFFPLVLLGLLAWLGLRARRLVPVLLGGAVVSAAAMALLHTPGGDPSRAYYGTDTRVQTLLVGAAAALVAPALRRSGIAVRLAPWVAATCLVGLLVVFAFATDVQPWLYQGGFLLIAALSTGLILGVFVAPGVVGKLLGVRPLVYVGVISYGLYVWHWPIFLWLTPDRVAVSGAPLVALRFFVVFVAATLSFYLVEAPVRYKVLADFAPRARLRIAGAAVAACVVALFASTALAGATTPAAGGSTASGSRLPAGGPGQDGGGLRVFMVGDSNSLSLRTQLPADLVGRLDVGGSTELGCGLIVDEHQAEQKRIIPEPSCYEWASRRPSDIAADGAEVGVLTAGSWEQYDRVVEGKLLVAGTPEYTDYLADQFVTLLDALHANTDRVAFVNDHCHRTADYGIGPEPRIVNDEERVAAVNAAVEEAIRRVDYPVKLIDVNGFLCPSGFEESRDGVKLRTDGLHFTAGGARVVWEWLAPQLEEQW